MFLFELFGINLDYKLIISFLVGLFFGLLMFILIYVILVLKSIGSKKFMIKTEIDDLTLQEVKDLVGKAQKEYKDDKLRGSTPKFSHCMNLSKDLVYAISTRYYPNSKYPMLELSIDELILLLGYIEKRLDEILDKRILRLVKRAKISTIYDISVKSSRVVQSKTYEVSKNVTKGVNTAKKVLNIINPAWWFRKTIMDTALDKILDKLYLVLIAIVGEETYKIYSKKFLNDESLDFSSDGVDEIVNSIEDDLKEAKDKIVSENLVNLDEDNFKNDLKKKIITNIIDVKNDYECIFDIKERLKS